MKTNLATSFTSKHSVPYFCLLPMLILSLCTLSACQKTPEPEAQTAMNVQSTPVATGIDDKKMVNEVELNADETAAERDRKINLAELENNIGAAGVTPNAETTTPSPEQAIKGTQITDVKYQNTAGDTLSVIFETSATGILNAIITLPDTPKITLRAPEGQGNNPTYQSKDGRIELISHGGGSTIDLMQNNKVTSFDAISAEAEVVTQP